MHRMHDDERNKCNGTDFAHEVPGLVRFRVDVHQDHRGTCGVFRRIHFDPPEE